MSRDKRETTGEQKARPTIGLITDQFVYEYQANIGAGVIDATVARDVNLVCFVGGRLCSYEGFEAQGNVIYDLIGAESVDGLVIMTSPVSSHAGREATQSFCEGFRPLPVVSVGLMMEGFPSLLVDNEKGLRDMLVHLVKDHAYRHIAFICGPEANEEADLRYDTYTSVLAEYGLPLDPALVVRGDFLRPSGNAAVDLLLDERKVDFDAIVAANDNMALGALETLQARGVRVPNDVAVVGFDDVQETRFVTPPLTTVRQLQYKLGQQAIEMVLALLAGEKVPEQVTLPTEAVIRQSCGCLSPTVLHVEPERAAKGKGQTSRAAVDARRAFAEQRESILSEMMQTTGISSVGFISEQAGQLLDAFLGELEAKPSGSFLLTLDATLGQTVATGGDVTVWQEALSTMHQRLLPLLQEDMSSRADNLLQRARSLVSETARRAQGHQALQADQRARTLWGVGATLITTFNLDELTDVLAEGLPGVGIPGVYLSLYEDPRPYTYPQSAPEWSHLILAYAQADAVHPGDPPRPKRIELEAGDRRFRSRQLVPEGLLSQDRRHDLVVRPLFFQQNQMGFVLFEIAQRELTICETLSTQISSALWGARLQEDRRQAEETLIEERNLLRTLIDNVPDRIYAKDTESRFIICNKALMQRMGASSPDDIIGKTDFDLVPHELAARFRADEEMIIQSGQPMLNREEPIDSPDGRMRWNLATKVPLRDSQGKIIGIVGVGREITELKRAEEALAEERNLLRTLIDALPDSVYVKDAESRFMIANAEATRRLGATTPDEVVGKTDLELYPERLATGYSADEQEVFRSGRPLINREELVVDQTTGERIWNLATKVPLRDSQGKVVALVGIGRNITERKIAEEALGYRSALLQTAAEVARATSGTLDLDELVQQVVDLLHERFGLYYAGLFLVDQSGSEGEPGKWAILRAGTGEAGRRMVGQGHRLEIGGESMIGWCIANSQARIALDVGEEAVRFENPFLPETRSELALPLVSRGEAIGALTIQSTQEAAFSGEDIAVLQTMASQVANALENTRLFAQAQLRAEEMVVLNELGQALSTHLSVRDVLNEVHQGASRLLDATNFYVALYDPDTHQVTFPYETTEEEEDLVPTMSADQGLTGYVIRHRTSLLIEEDVPKWMAEMGIEVVGKPSLCWLGAPMVAGDQVLGMLGVQSFTVSRAYGEHDRDLLVALANQTANAIANARLFEQAQTALREMEAVQRRYLQRVWSEYARTREVRGYEQTDDALIPLNDTLLPEVQQALQEQHSVVMDNGDGTSVLVVPVTLRGQPLGALGFRVEGGPERWSSDHIVLAEDVGEQLALAAENLRLLDETQRRAARERVTSEVTSRIRQSLDMERVLRAATDEIYQALGLERVVVRLKVGQDGANREGSTTGGGELGASQEEVA